jgi:hypothetical protein
MRRTDPILRLRVSDCGLRIQDSLTAGRPLRAAGPGAGCTIKPNSIGPFVRNKPKLGRAGASGGTARQGGPMAQNEPNSAIADSGQTCAGRAPAACRPDPGEPIVQNEPNFPQPRYPFIPLFRHSGMPAASLPCKTNPIGPGQGRVRRGLWDEGCCTNKPNSGRYANPAIGVPGRAKRAKQDAPDKSLVQPNRPAISARKRGSKPTRRLLSWASNKANFFGRPGYPTIAIFQHSNIPARYRLCKTNPIRPGLGRAGPRAGERCETNPIPCLPHGGGSGGSCHPKPIGRSRWAKGGGAWYAPYAPGAIVQNKANVSSRPRPRRAKYAERTQLGAVRRLDPWVLRAKQSQLAACRTGAGRADRAKQSQLAGLGGQRGLRTGADRAKQTQLPVAENPTIPIRRRMPGTAGWPP